MAMRGAKVLVIRVLDNDGNGNSGDVTAAVDYATGRGVDVINLSLGGSAPLVGGNDPDLDAALNRALDRGVVVVASAGNDTLPGIAGFQRSFPALPWAKMRRRRRGWRANQMRSNRRKSSASAWAVRASRRRRSTRGSGASTRSRRSTSASPRQAAWRSPASAPPSCARRRAVDAASAQPSARAQ